MGYSRQTLVWGDILATLVELSCGTQNTLWDTLAGHVRNFCSAFVEHFCRTPLRVVSHSCGTVLRTKLSWDTLVGRILHFSVWRLKKKLRTFSLHGGECGSHHPLLTRMNSQAQSQRSSRSQKKLWLVQNIRFPSLKVDVRKDVRENH